ncbi:hypothetical protein [Niabella hirudinis]
MEMQYGQAFQTKKILSFNSKQAQRAVNPYNYERPKLPVAAARR